MKNTLIQARDFLTESLAARVAVIGVIIGGAGWMFVVPGWAKLALVYYLALPLLAALAVGAGVA
jgi:type IV secretory pathway VirB2 component (pilin)